MHIIHISDTHFGNKQPVFDLEELKKALNRFSALFASPDTFMVVSGDISYQGSPTGYSQAQSFFEQTWLTNNGSRDRFLACPGNHDICEKSFEPFDRFLYGIRRDHLADFSQHAHALIVFENVAFLLINSSADLDHTYGWVDCEYLNKLLEENSNILSGLRHRIAVIHHHLIGIQKHDISTIRNSLRLISILDKFKFDLILHGHQHSQANLIVGDNKIRIFSARSLNYPADKLVNGINLIENIDNSWYLKAMVLSEDNSNINNLSFSQMEWQ